MLQVYDLTSRKRCIVTASERMALDYADILRQRRRGALIVFPGGKK